jgi:hypothetical protein
VQVIPPRCAIEANHSTPEADRSASKEGISLLGTLAAKNTAAIVWSAQFD